MKVFQTLSVRDFDGCAGAKDAVQELIDRDLVMDFDQQIEDLFPDGLSDTELNDILRFEDINEFLGIEEEEEA